MKIKDYIKRLFEENNKKLISNINTNIDTKTQLVSLENYYSEQEQVVGRWTDGKPIYQKTIIKTVPSSLTNRTWDIPHGINDLDIIINEKIIITSLDYSWYSEIPYVNTDVPNINRNVGLEEITQNNIRIKWGEGNSFASWNGTLHATIQYTKATDTESVQFALPALYKKDIKVNYSLEEQIIGTWIDGKPLYQKTISDTSPATTNGTMTDKFFDLNVNIDKFIDMYGTINTSGHNAVPLSPSVGKSTLSTGYLALLMGYNNEHETYSNKIRLSVSSESWANCPVYITVTYTKTTDTVANISQIPNLYDISRPDIWPENQEIYFGNKLYGYRYVEKNGNHTVNAKTSIGGTILTNVNIHHIVAQGGEIIGPDWNMPIGVHSNDFPIDCYYWVDHTNSALKTSMENAHTQNFIWTDADAWVTYIKE